MARVYIEFSKHGFKLLFLCICFSVAHSSENKFAILFPDTFDIDSNHNAPEFRVVGPIDHQSTLVVMSPSENNVIYVLRKGVRKGDTLSWNALEFMLRDCFCGRTYSLHAFNNLQNPVSKSVTIKNIKNPCPKLTQKAREEFIESEYIYPWLVPEKVADSTVGWVKTMWSAYPEYPPGGSVETTTIVRNRRIVRLLPSQSAKKDTLHPLTLTLKSTSKLQLRYTLNTFTEIHLVATSPKDSIDATIITIWSPSNVSSGILEIPMTWIYSLFPIGSPIGLLAVQGANRSNAIWVRGE